MKNLSRTVPSLSGTFGIHTQLPLNPKIPKEPSSPSYSNTQIDKILDKGQRTTTLCICHLVLHGILEQKLTLMA